MLATKPQFPGTGLPFGLFGAIVGISVALFMVAGGWLWAAPREASHLMRFTISYLVVVPLAALALAALHRWTWQHLLVAVGTIWCIKLVVTAFLFLALARGTAVQLEPMFLEPLATPPPASEAGYHAAGWDIARGALAGRVTLAGQPLGGAIVYLDRPPPGRPLAEGRAVDLVIEAARYARPLVLMATGDVVHVHSVDPALHTVHVHEGARALFNQPLPAHETMTLPLRRPGIYRVTCDNHQEERAWLVVADHPYATTTAADGRFALDEVPAGTLALAVVAVTDGGLIHETRGLTVAAGEVARPALIHLAPAPHPPARAGTMPRPDEKENALP